MRELEELWSEEKLLEELEEQQEEIETLREQETNYVNQITHLEQEQKNLQTQYAQTLKQLSDERAKLLEKEEMILKLSLSISMLKNECQNKSEKIEKLSEADLILKENVKLKSQNAELLKRNDELEVANKNAIQEAEYAKTHQKTVEIEKTVVKKEYSDRCINCSWQTFNKRKYYLEARIIAFRTYVVLLSVIMAAIILFELVKGNVFWKDAITVAIDIFNNIKAIVVDLNKGILKLAELSNGIPNDMIAQILKWGIIIICYGSIVALIVLLAIKWLDDVKNWLVGGLNVYMASGIGVLLIGSIILAEPVKELCEWYNLFAGWSVVSVVIWLVSAWWVKDNPRYYR